MEPTVGRVVHYGMSDGTPVPALVVAVQRGGVLDLAVLAPPVGGLATSVLPAWRPGVEHSEQLRPGRWSWPPRV